MQVLVTPKVVSGGTEIACPCPFCGETRPKLYIGPFDDSDDPVTYNCFICKIHGYVGQDFLDDYGVSSADINSDILKLNKSDNYKSRMIKGEMYHDLYWNFVSQNELSEYKLQYINKRLGVNFSYQDCVANKIILNIYDLLNANGIKNLTRYPSTVEQLNSYFIGFMTRTNSGLNMRNLVSGSYAESKLEESLQQKYINYNLFKTKQENDFYILPVNIDRTRHVKLFIGEGPFDILGIKYNLIKDDNNCIYAAGKGKAYEKVLFWTIKTIAPLSMEVHCFPDADVETSDILNIIEKYKVFPYTFFMHRNNYGKEKDFGVPAWRINDNMWRV
jgi:hypothetical protein